jgi:hypothetical protein
MARINCKKCGEDSGYTDDTLIENRTRSISIGTGDTADKGDICFCSDCWSLPEIGSVIDTLRS